MYPVSEAFLQAVQENTRKYKWAGSITAKNGTVYEFDSKDILKGSGYLINQCCGDGGMEFGGVYAAELGITLFSAMDRYSMDGAMVRLSYFLEVSPGVFEEVPLGEYEICEANVTPNYVAIKAYDHMLRFDKEIGNKLTNGNAFDLLSLACTSCDVALGHTKEELALWPNTEAVLSLYPENDVETWRDVIYYVAQALGAFATVNRYGKLELRKYGQAPVQTVSARHRFSSSFSDFVIKYTAVQAVNQKTGAEEYYAAEPDDGLTMALGKNPFLQYMTDEMRKTMVGCILEEAVKIRYVPYEVVTIGNPALDLGDVLIFRDGQADPWQQYCLTYYKLDINGRQTLRGTGRNTKVPNAKSKADKNLSGLFNQLENSVTVAQSYINAAEYVIRDSLTEIIRLDVVTSEDTFVQFHATVPVEVITEGKALLELFYIINGNMIPGHQPKQTACNGHHIISLFYPVDGLEADTVNEVCVQLKVTGGMVKIGRGAMVSAVYGHGIVVTSVPEWGGKIHVEDQIRVFCNGFRMKNLTDTAQSHFQVEQIYPVADGIAASCSGFKIQDLMDMTESHFQIEQIYPVAEKITADRFGNVLLPVTGAVAGTEQMTDTEGGPSDRVKVSRSGFSLVSWSEVSDLETVNIETEDV